MKKRLRKKLRLGEFRERGFEIQCRLRHEDKDWVVLDRFVDEVERLGLQCGGSGGPDEIKMFVALEAAGQATESHRDALMDWFQRDAVVATYRVGPLVWGDDYDPWDEQRDRGEWVEKS